MSFDIEEEVAALSNDLESMEIRDFLTELVKYVKNEPYAQGKKIDDRFMDGFVTINENQKHLMLVSLTYEFWKFVNGEKTMA